MDYAEALQEGQGTLAWLTAVMLALGGTAVVVAVWLQLRRGVSARTVLRGLLGLRTQDTAPAPRTRPAETEAPAQVVRAYRAVAEESVPASPAPPRQDGPALTERQLNVYLERLRTAADALEAVARRGGDVPEPDAPVLQEI